MLLLTWHWPHFQACGQIHTEVAAVAVQEVITATCSTVRYKGGQGSMVKD
jgi:hypothetical protein